jgi:hypothetical protein
MQLKLFHLSILLSLLSCTGKRAPAGADVLYADYQITGEEGAENVTCLLRFLAGGSQGTPVLLEPPASVSLDGTLLQADSARLSGAYYELQQPTEAFKGTHTIIFKNAEGREYKETFDFQPFAMMNDLGKTVPRGDITIQLDGLMPAEAIRVLLTDTSFYTDDINEVNTIQSGTLVITQDALHRVASGPVTLYLFKEEEHRLKNAPAGGGKLSITYGLSREFELVEE